MKVMLIQPPSGSKHMDTIFMHEPLALEYLGAGLSLDNHEVVIFDARLESDYEAALRSYKPQVVGLTAFIGFESFTNKHLNDLKKNITVEQQYKAARILNDLKIGIAGSFMVDPSYTREDFDGLISHIRTLKVDVVICSILTPLPGTQLYESKKAELITDKPEAYDFLHTVLPTKLPLKQFYSEFSRLIIKATPLLTSLKFIGKYEKGNRLRTLLISLKLIRIIRNGYRLHE